MEKYALYEIGNNDGVSMFLWQQLPQKHGKPIIVFRLYNIDIKEFYWTIDTL